MNLKQFTSVSTAMRGLHFSGPPEVRARRTGDPAERFAQALQFMEDGLWPQAYAQLAALADGGHRQSARIAMLFTSRGALLFGGSFKATSRQRECWLRAGE